MAVFLFCPPDIMRHEHTDRDHRRGFPRDDLGGAGYQDQQHQDLAAGGELPVHRAQAGLDQRGDRGSESFFVSRLEKKKKKVHVCTRSCSSRAQDDTKTPEARSRSPICVLARFPSVWLDTRKDGPQQGAGGASPRASIEWLAPALSWLSLDTSERNAVRPLKSFHIHTIHLEWMGDTHV